MLEKIAAPTLAAAHPFLATAGPAAATALLAAAQPFAAPRRDVIFAPEAAPEALYLLLEGSVGLSMQGADGTRGLLDSAFQPKPSTPLWRGMRGWPKQASRKWRGNGGASRISLLK